MICWPKFFDDSPVRPAKIEPIEDDDGLKLLRLTYWAVDPNTKWVRYFVMTVDRVSLARDPRGLRCHVLEMATDYAKETGCRLVNREDVEAQWSGR